MLAGSTNTVGAVGACAKSIFDMGTMSRMMVNNRMSNGAFGNLDFNLNF